MQITFQLGTPLLCRESHIVSQQRTFSQTFVNEVHFKIFYFELQK